MTAAGCLQVTTAVPSQVAAGQLARVVVESRLAAAVQVVGRQPWEPRLPDVGPPGGVGTGPGALPVSWGLAEAPLRWWGLGCSSS